MNHIGREIIKKLKDQDSAKLALKLYTPRIINNVPIPFDEEKNIFRRMIEVELNAQDIGE